jgi:hypothetical protein
MSQRPFIIIVSGREIELHLPVKEDKALKVSLLDAVLGNKSMYGFLPFLTLFDK